jgi:hypothetical protein
MASFRLSALVVAGWMLAGMALFSLWEQRRSKRKG